MRHFTSSLLPLLAAGVAGCTALSDPAEDEPAPVQTIEQAAIAIDCDEWQCSSNSPHIDTYIFHELSTIVGVPNLQGFSVVALMKNSHKYKLVVTGGKISGVDSFGTIQGQALTGAEIWVERSPRAYAIRITSVDTTKMWAKLAGVEKTMETYQLDVSELVGSVPNGEWVNICKHPPGGDSPDAGDMNVFHSVVFEGERIDSVTKTIKPTLEPAWFNIGCAGHALAKLALGGHTEAARTHGFITTIPERQTYLKAVTGDYCGKGKPYTVAGQELEWKDAHGYMAYRTPPASLKLEARWGSKGAKCLNQPRIDANRTALGDTVFSGKVKLAIAAECTIPTCSGGPEGFGSEYLVTANPP